MTLIDSILLGLSRKVAFGTFFYLAIPIAGPRRRLQALQGPNAAVDGRRAMFGVGLLLFFISACLCIRWLLRYIASHDFVPYTWCRIAFRIGVLVTSFNSLVMWSVRKSNVRGSKAGFLHLKARSRPDENRCDCLG